MRQFGIAASASLLLHVAVLLGVQALNGDDSSAGVVLLPATVFDVALVRQLAPTMPRGGAPKRVPVAEAAVAKPQPAGRRSLAASEEHRPQSSPATDSVASGGSAPVEAGTGTETGSGAGAGTGSGPSGESGALQLATPIYRLNPPPVYPQVARQRRFEGVVLLRVLVLADGMVGELRLEKTSGHAVLDQAALKAVRGWAFASGRRGGVPAAMEVLVPVRFTLE